MHFGGLYVQCFVGRGRHNWGLYAATDCLVFSYGLLKGRKTVGADQKPDKLGGCLSVAGM